MFKFGFKIDEEVEKSDEKEAPPESTAKKSDEPEYEKCVEVKLADDIVEAEKSKSRPLNTFVTGDYEIFNVEPLEVEVTRSNHSDLISGVYEGGLKVWECTQDLADYLLTNEIDMKEKKILDLGCGAGVLGILAAICGGEVMFQDYNKDVLTTTTAVNILENKGIYDEINIDTCRLFSGDWDDFTQTIEADHTFDIILTSETIYNPSNYQKLTNCFRKLLKPEGVVYVAAKTYYFGVGGGLRTFEATLNDFDHEIVWKCDTGVSREILKINKRKE